MAVEIIFKSRAAHPLFNQYPNETFPDKAFLELDLENGQLSAGHKLGVAVPQKVYAGHVRRYSVPPKIHREELLDLLEEVKPLADRIEAGYDSRFDGQSIVAVLDDDAQAAETEIKDICAALDETCELPRRPGRKPGVRTVSKEKEAKGRCITLPHEMWERVDIECENRNITRAAFFREVLEKYWKR